MDRGSGNVSETGGITVAAIPAVVTGHPMDHHRSFTVRTAALLILGGEIDRLEHGRMLTHNVVIDYPIGICFLENDFKYIMNER